MISISKLRNQVRALTKTVGNLKVEKMPRLLQVCMHTVHVHIHMYMYMHMFMFILPCYCMVSSYVLTVIFLVLYCYRNSFFDG